MTYIDLINGFWRVSHEVNQFSTTDIALYFHLLDISNRCNWPDFIKRNNCKIQADLSISFPTLNKARNRLKQAGVIDFKTQNGSSNTTYTLKNIFKVCNEVHNEVSSEVHNEVVNEVRNELIKTKSKTKTLKKDNIQKRETDFIDSLSQFAPVYGHTTIDAFAAYWTEPNQDKTRMRFEMEKTWDTGRRLKTWVNRSTEYKLNSGGQLPGQTLPPESDEKKQSLINRFRHGQS